MPKNKETKTHRLPSNHQLDDTVQVSFIETQPAFLARVTGIHFYKGQVKYDIEFAQPDGVMTRFVNIDSIFVNKN